MFTCAVDRNAQICSSLMLLLFYYLAASAGFVACRSYAVRGKLMMRAVPPIRASFQPAFPQHSSFQDANRKKQTVPCYQRQQAPQIEAKIVSPSHPLVKRSKDRQGKKVP
jgi:hypothetical protein